MAMAWRWSARHGRGSAVGTGTGAGAAVLLGSLLLYAVGCGSPAPEAPRNVILVTLDTTRADHLGCYGHELAVTPTLDSLSTAGATFEWAICTTPVTLPSHSTILTGLSPLRHGVRDNGIFKLGPEFETVAERLLAANYQTGAFVSAYVLEHEYGTAQGFTTYDDQVVVERSAPITTRHAMAWMESLDRSRPYFLWLHLYDPHLPWIPPEPFASMDQLDPYDQEVAGMDKSLGDFFRRARSEGLLENTSVLLVGDHGEGLGGHGEPQHGVFLYDDTIHVPFIVVDDKGRGRGQRFSPVVSTEDVMPTLLALAGQPVPDGLDGHDLMPFVEGKAEAPRSYAYAETYFPAYNFHHSQTFALRSDRWKYIHAPESELYHVRRDPAEATNLIASYPDTAVAYNDRIRDLRGEAGMTESEVQAISGEELERLQSLGYLGGAGVEVELAKDGEFNLPDPKEMIPFIDDFDQGIIALTEQKYEESVERLGRVIEQHPENLIARMNLGKALTRLGRLEEAKDQYVEAALLAPNSGTCRNLLGEGLDALGRYEEAIVEYEKIADDPTYGNDARQGIALSLLHMGRAEDALLTLRKLADDVGGDANNFSNLSDKVSSYIEARDAVAADPSDERRRLRLAELAIDLRLLDEADRALRFRGSTPTMEAMRRRAAGSVAGARGDVAGARREFEAALGTLRQDVYVRSHLIGIYLDANELDRALELAEELIRTGQADAVVYYNKACALSRQGRVDEALDELQRAVRRGYTDAVQISRDPDLAPVRKSPRFPALLEVLADSSN